MDGARGLVTAEPITAIGDVPPFDNTAMDGFAVRSVDTVGPPVELVWWEPCRPGCRPRSGWDLGRRCGS